jgi:hypothetical protein
MNYFLVYALLWAAGWLTYVFYLITIEDIKITNENKKAKRRKANGLKITQFDYK